MPKTPGVQKLSKLQAKSTPSSVKAKREARMVKIWFLALAIAGTFLVLVGSGRTSFLPRFRNSSEWTDYGGVISLQHPSDWSLSVVGQSFLLQRADNPGQRVELYVYDHVVGEGETLEDFLFSSLKADPERVTPARLWGFEGFSVSFPPEVSQNTFFFLRKSNHAIRVQPSPTLSQENEVVVSRILETIE